MSEMNLNKISADESWNFCLNLLLDDSISEIESNGPDKIFAKRSGRRVHLTNIGFDSEEAYSKGIHIGLVPHIRSHLEYRPDEYIFEGPLRYKVGDKEIVARCHIVLPPAAEVPQVTIAKKSTALATLDDIANKGSMAAEMLEFVKAAVAADATCILSGGTGAGKTTFLEAFCKHIPLDVRIGVAEDTPELMLPHPNATYLHSVPWKPGMEEKDVATLSWVVAQFNRMRVDKLIVGETRGKEFGDFLIAANSGMEGSLTTIHANDPSRTLDKMTNFALKSSPGTPIRSINYDIASSIDLIIQLAYFKADSRYRVTAIEEISTTVGTSEAASIATNRLYTYDPENDNWKKDGRMTDELRAKFKAHNVSTEIFNKTVAGDILLAPGESGQTSRPIGLPVRRA